MPVVLWTDALIFLLAAVMVGMLWQVRRRPQLRAAWRRVARSRLGMAAAVVLAGYVCIGLLDSLHFYPRLSDMGAQPRYSVELLSLFDLLAQPLRERVEKTYSAPFATHLYTRENVPGGEGERARGFPRLVHGGAHLADPDRRFADIAARAVQAAGEGLLATALAGMALVWLRAGMVGDGFRASLGAMLGRRTEVPWLVILATLGAVLVLAFACARLGVRYHVLGTDKVGQDVLYQALKSIRTGLVIGSLTTLVMLPFAILLGILAGWFRGWVDDLIQYLYTTLNSIPGVLLIAASILMVQVYMAGHADSFGSLAERADMRLLSLCVILGITSWTTLCRLLRGETLKLREVEYIQAAQALGVGHMGIIRRHILPNLMHIVLITVVLDFSSLVLAEAVLSYVNIGVDPSTISWGNMINGARLEMAREPIVWWSLAAAFAFMFALVLAANLFADAVRDAFDPRLRHAR